jgi:DNA adenine methylase
VLADNNDELMLTYRKVRSHARRIATALAELDQSPATYNRFRALDPANLSDTERAIRFIYLNRLCFNGVYRTNRHGAFNVPMGTRTSAMPTVETLTQCAAALRGKTLMAGDFEQAVALAGRRDFVYLDPPYSPARPRRGEYGYGCFGDSDIDRLVKSIQAADARGAYVLVSYSDYKPLVRALPDWHVVRVRARRFVAADPAARSLKTDLLISNYRARTSAPA